MQLNKSIHMGFDVMRRISMDESAIELANYIIKSKDTVRGIAKKYEISKSTVKYQKSR